MSLAKHVDHILTQYAPTSHPDDVRLVEVCADDYDASGRPIVRRASLVEPSGYAARFSKLLTSGYSWLNLSFYGFLDDRPLIAIELPRNTGAPGTTTSVNYSGPSRLVSDAGGDARAGISLQ